MVYLDSSEREMFSQKHLRAAHRPDPALLPHRLEGRPARFPDLQPPHPRAHLRRAPPVHERANGWGNLSGVDGRDPITHAELLLNTTSRFGKKPALYWRGVVPYQHHRNIPEAYIYVMSFALTPEDSQQPSGSLNLSCIDNVELVLDMQSALANESYTVFVFARSWNPLRGGATAGVKYA